ncbi:hypothetical protein BT69DRAFT_587406 [Atractiella rhizophila]|nr:hypothetical protein BT69DRAFT_587406 [Atractiella rhizophila]
MPAEPTPSPSKPALSAALYASHRTTAHSPSPAPSRLNTQHESETEKEGEMADFFMAPPSGMVKGKGKGKDGTGGFLRSVLAVSGSGVGGEEDTVDGRVEDGGVERMDEVEEGAGWEEFFDLETTGRVGGIRKRCADVQRETPAHCLNVPPHYSSSPF